MDDNNVNSLLYAIANKSKMRYYVYVNNNNNRVPPDANVLWIGWKAIELTGYINSCPSSFTLWHLKAYFFFCASGFISIYSTDTRP